MIAAVAVVALGLAGWQAYLDPVTRWRRAIRDDNEGARRYEAIQRAVSGTAPGVDPATVLAELTAALDDPGFRVRQGAAQGLGRLGAKGDPAVPALVAALRDPNPWVRSASADALGNIVAKSDHHRGLAIAPLVAALADRNRDARLTAASALVRLGEGAAAVSTLIALLPEPGESIRNQVLWNLGQAGDAARPAVPRVLRVAAEYNGASSVPERSLRILAAETLRRLGEFESSGKILREAAQDPDPEIRRFTDLVIRRLEARALLSPAEAGNSPGRPGPAFDSGDPGQLVGWSRGTRPTRLGPRSRRAPPILPALGIRETPPTCRSPQGPGASQTARPMHTAWSSERTLQAWPTPQAHGRIGPGPDPDGETPPAGGGMIGDGSIPPIVPRSLPMLRRIPIAFASLSLLYLSASMGGDAPSKPTPNSASEPIGEFSIARGARFLDAVSADWTRQRKCGTCHTNYAHMMAGPTVKGPASPELVEVRSFFEGRAAGWDRPEKGSKPIAEGEVVAVAAALALNDAASAGKLRPITRVTLDRIWTTQRPDGGWNWFDCDYPPSEDDDYYGTVLATIAVGHAPDNYKATDAAKRGLDKVRGYLRANPAPNLHHRALLLWASTGVDGLMDAPERERTIAELLSKQRPDGGWALTSLGHWGRRDGSANPEDGPGDGYGTGYVVYVLRQAGMPADSDPIRRGVAWLKTHQRASGRWFTRSPSLDHSHFLTHAGTGFALMALAACGEE